MLATFEGQLYTSSFPSNEMCTLLKRLKPNFHIRGRVLLEVQPLTLLYTIFHEKGTPFVYLLLTNSTPFTYFVKSGSA